MTLRAGHYRAVQLFKPDGTAVIHNGRQVWVTRCGAELTGQRTDTLPADRHHVTFLGTHPDGHEIWVTRPCTRTPGPPLGPFPTGQHVAAFLDATVPTGQEVYADGCNECEEEAPGIGTPCCGAVLVPRELCVRMYWQGCNPEWQTARLVYTDQRQSQTDFYPNPQWIGVLENTADYASPCYPLFYSLKVVRFHLWCNGGINKFVLRLRDGGSELSRHYPAEGAFEEAFELTTVSCNPFQLEYQAVLPNSQVLRFEVSAADTSCPATVATCSLPATLRGTALSNLWAEGGQTFNLPRVANVTIGGTSFGGGWQGQHGGIDFGLLDHRGGPRFNGARGFPLVSNINLHFGNAPLAGFALYEDDLGSMPGCPPRLWFDFREPQGSGITYDPATAAVLITDPGADLNQIYEPAYPTRFFPKTMRITLAPQGQTPRVLTASYRYGGTQADFTAAAVSWPGSFVGWYGDTCPIATSPGFASWLALRVWAVAEADQCRALFFFRYNACTRAYSLLVAAYYPGTAPPGTAFSLTAGVPITPTSWQPFYAQTTSGTFTVTIEEV